MNKETITVNVSLVNGSEANILDNATPEEAISDYLYPDSGTPVRTVSIRVCDSNGKQVQISIFPGGITIRDIAE